MKTLISGKLQLFTLLFLGVAITAAADPLVVSGVSATTSGSALTLAQLLAGSGITVDSASLTGQDNGINPGAFQQGTFTGGTGILPFGSGVLLTTGNALDAPGPNNSPSKSTSWNSAGDSQLDALSGGTTHDANILTFTFHKSDANAPDVVSFQYVFASEEYNEFVGSQFNDVFGFFLNGSNIALVPGTSTPVAINTVNCGSNAAYYQSNDPFTGTAGGCNGSNSNLNLQYDGVAGGLGSLALFATGNLQAGENTISLKIADTSDTIYDSGVFLAANSFTAAPPPGVPEPSALPLFGMGAIALVAFQLRKKFANILS